MNKEPEALRLAAFIEHDAQVIDLEVVGRPSTNNMRAAAAELRRLYAVNQELLEACQTFVEWLRREEAGFDHETHSRQTPEGEAAWRTWFYENLAICNLAQTQARAAIAKAGETE